MKQIITLFIVLLLPFLSFSQTTLWNDTFDTQIGKGVSGNGVDLSGVNWTLDYSDCSLGDGDDYVKVDSHYSHGRFTAKHCGGEAIWESEEITITDYINVKISVSIGETGSSDNAARKYIKLYSVVDGIESPFVANGEGLGNFGTKVATTTADVGDKLKIRVKLKSTLAQKVYFNAIEVTGEQGTTPSNDADSEISVSDTPILAQTFTAIEAHTASREVFRFKVTDKGTADGKPTVLTKIVLNKGVNNTLNWENELEEVVIETGTVFFTGGIIGNDLVFDIPENAISIADNSSQEFTVSIKTAENIADNRKFQVLIDANHSFEASNLGSTFRNTLALSIVSAITTINVKATKLRFKTQPSDTQINKPITPAIEVEAIDNYGNIDKECIENIKLIATNIGGTTTIAAINGLATFDDIVFSTATANTTITASGNLLNSIESIPFSVIERIDRTSIIKPTVLPATTNIYPNETKELFAFTIEDKGGDEYPTKVSQLVIFPAPSNQLKWSEVLQNVTLQSDGQTISSTITISDANITIPIADEALTIEEGTSVILTLVGTLAPSKITEDKVLAFKIPANNHQAETTDSYSSKFATTFNTAIVSNDIKTAIEATRLFVTEQPIEETVGKPFEQDIVVQMQDDYGNIDTDNTLSSARISIANGTGTLSPMSELTQQFSNGICQWKNLIYNRVETATFKIEAGGFTINSQPITFLKGQTSLIEESDNPIANDTISTIRNTELKAKDCFKFKIVDKGDDGLPTIIKKIRFVKGDAFSQTRLYYLIGGIILKQNNDIIGKISKLDASSGSSNVEITLNTPLRINDGNETEITASIYLSTHKKLQDGEKIQLAIDKKHGWDVSDEGSLLVSPLVEDISSSILTIDAIATQLAFDKVPKNITVDTPFRVSVSATDADGKIDEDYKGAVTLSREAGTGVLSSDTGLTLNFTKGKATWNALQYDTGENFTLLATSPNFAPIESPAINSLDKDSEILAPVKQFPASAISSLITQETAPKEIFSFTIADKGTNDKQPTILKALSFKNTFLPNSASWKANIKGAALLQNGQIIATTDKISNEEIIFSSTNGIVSIPDGTKQNFTLAIYLKYNNIEDNKLIQCKISSAKMDFKTDGAGSALGNLDTDIISSIVTIEVKATQIDFLDAPFALHTPKKPFSVSVGARDTNGNIDADYTAQLSLAGTEQLATTNFINGVATVVDIIQNSNTDFHLTAESGSLTSANHDVKISPISIDLEDNFESGTLNGWLSTTDWNPSILNPINGKKSLKHNLNNTSGTSHIAKSIGNFNLKNGTTIWRWQMKNGNWKPSSSNNFYYVLTAESNDFSNGIRYIVGVHQTGSTNLLSLCKIQDDKTTTLLTSEMNWNDSETVGIQVKLDSEGKWELAYDNNGGFDNLYTTGSAIDDVLPTETLYSGLVFNYASASRAGLFWADDMLTYHFTTSPKVDSLKVISATELKIFFNQTMDKASIENSQNYAINKNVKVTESKQEKPNEATLSIEILKTDAYQITLKGLKNEVGILMPDTTLSFNYFSDAQEGELVINEMMIDENPAVKLPEYEYIELYNTTEKPFILKDWTITVGKYERTIPTDTIQPDEYILLCATKAKEALAIYGKTIAVPSFPTLANSGTTVVLKNVAKVEIDKVTYAKDWYNNKAKNEGGWSLERIDPNAASNNRANWSAAYDERGGTPGEKNSVFGVVLDNIPPQIVRVAPISKNQLVITLSEPIDALAALQPNLYVVNGIGKPETVIISEDGTTITLTFKEEFDYGKTYTLTIKEVIDLFGNAMENASATFGLPEIALANELIINEILFNPVSGNVDYVELYNHSNKILDLATIFMATRDNKNSLKSVYLLSKEARMLSPEEFVVVTTKPELVAEQYEVKYPERMLKMAALPSFPNDKGIVVLLNQENTVIDEFHYNDDMHLKLLVSTDGVSLERIYYDLPTQDRNNWHSAAEVAGYGTPTYKNSAFSENKPIDDQITIDPKVFSPNGDGIDDMMQIHYQFEEPGQVANITIFDSKGRLVIDLARSVTLDTKGMISWDGVNADNQRARTGRYIIFIELFDVNGNVRTYKKTCVLHGHFK